MKKILKWSLVILFVVLLIDLVLYPICFQSITGYSFASLILAS